MLDVTNATLQVSEPQAFQILPYVIINFEVDAYLTTLDTFI
jgi:hypothetical protein